MLESTQPSRYGRTLFVEDPSSTGQRSVATEPQPKPISPRFFEVP